MEGELDRANGGQGELDGTSGGKGELDGTSGGRGVLDGTSGLGEPRMTAKVLREWQTKMSCGRRRRSSTNSGRPPANAGLGELRTAVNSIFCFRVGYSVTGLHGDPGTRRRGL